MEKNIIKVVYKLWYSKIETYGEKHSMEGKLEGEEGLPSGTGRRERPVAR
jgi:hypothetical protein